MTKGIAGGQAERRIGGKKMKLYAYCVEDMTVLKVVEGIDNADCERQMDELCPSSDEIGWTYTPAFGFADGLME